MKTLLALCLAAAGLAGCAVVPVGPAVYVDPGPVVVRPGPVVVRPYYGSRGRYHRW